MSFISDLIRIYSSDFKVDPSFGLIHITEGNENNFLFQDIQGKWYFGKIAFINGEILNYAYCWIEYGRLWMDIYPAQVKGHGSYCPDPISKNYLASLIHKCENCLKNCGVYANLLNFEISRCDIARDPTMNHATSNYNQLIRDLYCTYRTPKTFKTTTYWQNKSQNLVFYDKLAECKDMGIIIPEHLKSENIHRCEWRLMKHRKFISASGIKTVREFIDSLDLIDLLITNQLKKDFKFIDLSGIPQTTVSNESEVLRMRMQLLKDLGVKSPVHELLWMMGIKSLINPTIRQNSDGAEVTSPPPFPDFKSFMIFCENEKLISKQKSREYRKKYLRNIQIFERVLLPGEPALMTELINKLMGQP